MGAFTGALAVIGFVFGYIVLPILAARLTYVAILWLFERHDARRRP